MLYRTYRPIHETDVRLVVFGCLLRLDFTHEEIPVTRFIQLVRFGMCSTPLKSTFESDTSDRGKIGLRYIGVSLS